MLNKTFLAAFAAAVVAMSVLIFYAHQQIQSIGFKPEVIAENFLAANSLSWKFLWFSAIALLILANVVLWTTRRSWAMWSTLGYFAVFAIVETWWLGGLFSEFGRQNSLSSSFGYMIGTYVFGAVLCILAAVIVFFNQFLVVRLIERIRPPAGVETLPTTDNVPPSDSI